MLDGRWAEAFRQRSKQGIGKTTIGTDEVREFLCAEFLPGPCGAEALRVEEVTRAWKDKSQHITLRTFVRLVLTADLYCHRWGELSEDVVLMLVFAGLDKKARGVVESGSRLSLSRWLADRYAALPHDEAARRRRALLVRLQPRFFGDAYRSADALRAGLRGPKALEVFRGLFPLDPRLVQPLSVLFDQLARATKDATVPRKAFVRLCTTLEFLAERTQRVSALEVYAAVFLALDPQLALSIPAAQAALFFPAAFNAYFASPAQPVSLVEFLNVAQKALGLRLPIADWYTFVCTPFCALGRVFPPPPPEPPEPPALDAPRLLADLRLDPSLLDAMAAAVPPVATNARLRNAFLALLRDSVRLHGREEGVLRAVYAIVQQNGLDHDAFRTAAAVLGCPLSPARAELAVLFLARDASHRVLLPEFLLFWLGRLVPDANAAQAAQGQHAAFAQRCAMAFRYLTRSRAAGEPRRHTASTEDITGFLRELYGDDVTPEESQAVWVLAHALSRDGALDFPRFVAFLEMFEESCKDTAPTLLSALQAVARRAAAESSTAILANIFDKEDAGMLREMAARDAGEAAQAMLGLLQREHAVCET